MTRHWAIVRREGEELIDHLHSLSGREVLTHIFNRENPSALIRGLSSQDFYWLVKKVGEEDSHSLLHLATPDQWQYLIDLDLWVKDQVQLHQFNFWLRQLLDADARRLVQWILSEEQELFSYFLFRTVQIAVKSEEEGVDPGAEYFTVDGLFYVKPQDPKDRETVEQILRGIADEDYNRYQALLLGHAGLLPAETEEELYRLRNVRLWEHGFLPREEALSVYAPLDPVRPEAEGTRGPDENEPVNAPDPSFAPPLAPFSALSADHLLRAATTHISDPLQIDRLKIEFAGLCNQILSADGLQVEDTNVLLETCRKAAGYLNLALEQACGKDLVLAGRILEKTPLVNLFRMGFGLAMKVKWEMERGLKGSWFQSKGLDYSFWGEQWGELWIGLSQKRPKFPAARGGEFKEFEGMSEILESRRILRYALAMDGLLRKLEDLYPTDKDVLQSEDLTFHSLLFTLWARHLLRLECRFSPLSQSGAKSFFSLLRSGEKEPPYQMPGWGKRFSGYFLNVLPELDPERASVLEEALAEAWSLFREEYERVPVQAIQRRSSRFLLLGH